MKLTSKNPIRTVQVEIVHPFSQSILFFILWMKWNRWSVWCWMPRALCRWLIQPLYTHFLEFCVQWHPNFLLALNIENSFRIGTIVNYHSAAYQKLCMKRVKLGAHQSTKPLKKRRKKHNWLQSIKLMNKFNRNENDDPLYSRSQSIGTYDESNFQFLSVVFLCSHRVLGWTSIGYYVMLFNQNGTPNICSATFTYFNHICTM